MKSILAANLNDGAQQWPEVPRLDCGAAVVLQCSNPKVQDQQNERPASMANRRCRDLHPFPLLLERGVMRPFVTHQLIKPVKTNIRARAWESTYMRAYTLEHT